MHCFTLSKVTLLILFTFSMAILKCAHADDPFEITEFAVNINPHFYLKAYPDHLAAIEGNNLIWKDGTVMPIRNSMNAQNLAEALDNPDLYTQLSIPYPRGPLNGVPTKGSDPGRIRYVPFFQKMYGQTENEVEKNLTEIAWLPRSFTGDSAVKIKVSRVNNVDRKMQKLSDELDELVIQKPQFKKFLANPAGTFSWRLIAGTQRPSAHSFGMTIDINLEHSNYWLWDYKQEKGLSEDSIVNESDLSLNDVPNYRNEIPKEIVEIFEKHHFIWGGKWFHYDTMHFEYRPELFVTGQ